MEFVLGLFSSPSVEDWTAALTGMVTAATAVTALTSSRSDNVAMDIALRVLNMMAGNFAKNRNKDD